MSYTLNYKLFVMKAEECVCKAERNLYSVLILKENDEILCNGRYIFSEVINERMKLTINL